MLSRTSTTLLDGLHDPENQQAWRRFYGRYVPMLLSYAKRVGLSDADSQDAVAATLTTFVEAYRDGRYDRSQGRLKSWLGGIIQNKIRKIRERRPPASIENHSEPAAAFEPDDAFEREWQLQRLADAMELLRQEIDPNTFQAFDLYTLKGWPAGQVADFLGMSINAVYISKSRTVERLRQIAQRLTAEEERSS